MAWIVERLKRAWFVQGSFAREQVQEPDFPCLGTWGEENKRLIAFDEATIGAALISSDGQILQPNRVLCEMLGYSAHELRNYTIETLIQSDELSTWSQLHHQLINASAPFTIENRYKHGLGHTIWAAVTFILISNNRNESNLFFIYFHDITRYKQSNEVSQQNQELLQGVIEGIPDAVFIKDRQGRYLIANNKGAKLHGKPVAEIIGKLDIELFSIEEIQSAIEIDREVVESGESRVYELAITIDGLTRAILFTKTPFLNHLGEIVGIVVIASDITEHQRASESLENSRAELRALSAKLQSVREEERARIAREIHDELGQVLTGLKIDLVSLTKKISNSVSKTDWATLKERSQGITELINNAIQTVRKISTELRPGLLDAVGLTAAIEWQAKEFETRTGIKCKLKFSHPNITVDQNRSIAVFRIFQEILTNVARHSQATEIGISIELRDSELYMQAKDNGRGIRANEFSNPNSLGLLGMRERALLLGGEVNFRGVPNKGTTVTVLIPFDQRSI
ncbi:MAG: PAS domain S-box protein [Blastocatellia bacterium]